MRIAFHALPAEAARPRAPGWTIRDGRSLGTVPPTSKTLVQVQTGVGLAEARRCARALPPWPFEGAVLGGFAGALDEELEAGTVFVADRVLDESGRAYEPPLTSLLEDVATRAGLPVRRGVLVSIDRVVTDAAAKRELAARSGADAVDMESFALAEILAARDVAFGVARIVLDRASESLPAGGSVRSALAELGRSRSLGSLIGWVRIGARVRPSARRGARFLEAWLNESRTAEAGQSQASG